MKLQSLTQSLSLLSEHHIPVKGSEEDLLKQVGSETIDLSNLNKMQFQQRPKIYDLGKTRAYVFDDDEAMYKISYPVKVKANDIDHDHDRFYIELEFDANLRNLIRTRVSYMAKDEMVSYTSKKHNILLPPWLIYMAKADIRKSASSSS